MEPDRRIVVFGAGAVGGYLGAKLSAAGNNITLVARPRIAEAIEAGGLTVWDGEERLVSHPRAVTSVEGVEADLVLLTVRTFDVREAIDPVKRLLAPDGLLFAFQNGVGTEEGLAGVFGNDRVVAATLTISVGMEEPGVIRVYGHGGVALARMDGSSMSAEIRKLFADAGIETVVIDDYRSLRWSKLLLNMLAAPTSAILDADIDTIASDPRVFGLEQAAFREALGVMKAMGVRVIDLPGYRVRQAKLAMSFPRAVAQRIVGPRLVRARSGHSPGMRSDMERGRTEIDAFNGAIATAGDETRASTPVNRALAQLTNQLAESCELREKYHGRPDRLLEYVNASSKTSGDV